MSFYRWLSTKILPWLPAPTVITIPADNPLVYIAGEKVILEPGNEVVIEKDGFAVPVFVLGLQDFTFGRLMITVAVKYGNEYWPYLERSLEGVSVAVDTQMPPCDGVKVTLALRAGRTTPIRYRLYGLAVARE